MFSNTNSNNNPSGVDGWSFNAILSNVNAAFDLTWNDDSFKNDLYYQDMITMNNGDILWIYMPNSLKLNKNGNYLTVKEYNQRVWAARKWAALIIKKSSLDDVILNKKNQLNNNDIVDVSSNLGYILGANLGTNGQLSTYIQPIFIPGSNMNQNSVEYNRLSVYYPVNNGVEILVLKYNPDNSNPFSYVQRLNPNGASSYNHSPVVYSNAIKIGQWTKEYNNAMLIPTRNMFDETIVTIPFVYTSINKDNKSVNLPIFNVDTLHFDKAHLSTATNTLAGFGTKTKKFNFGQKIYTAYSTSGWETLNPSQDTSDNIIWYPWPGAVKANGLNGNFDNYTHQLYSRLINVSPYDNTIIYASRPSFKVKVNSSIVGDYFNGNNSYKNTYASFWIGNSSTGAMSNFIIPNKIVDGLPYNAYINSLIDSGLIEGQNIERVDNIYKSGFWFDINSIQNNNVNLYINTTGTLKDKPIADQNNKVNSSPIAMISWTATNNHFSDFFSQNLTNIKSNYEYYNHSNFQLKIENNSYSNYITSRADLTKWYPSMYQSLTQGVNSITNNQLFLSSTNSNKQVVTNFNEKVTNNPNSPYEIFSIWKTGNNYNNIPINNYTISANNDSNNQATSNLNLLLKFQLNNSSWNNSFISTSDINKAKTIEIPMTVPNVSWQFLSSWSTNAKLNGYNTPTNN
ncbi:MAG: hypothetical protein HDR43_01395, partial [Mycoplasma sp.]|nr:hypothetical protein [Mycoplasma sp.]